MKGSLVIIGFFILGVLCGLFHIVPSEIADSTVSFAALCALIFCVGISIGCDSKVLDSLRRINPRLLLLPLFTMAGTLAGCAAASLLLPHRTLTDCLSIGSGFGYYSLSSIFITEYRGAALGTVALLSNIIRELLTLLAAPLLAKWFGPLAPISVGGATSMDTTLPIITRYSGKEFVTVSIFHGFCMDFSVPFLVTFFCEL
ncbi:MAG: lysine exporter LysO family protein [Prevotella sp.]|nr:lysine exporter LysO family protein [Prevotella sp.]MDY4037840.1 lysine exporter LysO family protein [Prevotella sp.]